MWIDADAIFTNYNIKISDIIDKYPDKHFYLTKDPKTYFINSGVQIWKNSDLSYEILTKWWDSEHLSYGKGGDQVGIGNILKNNLELKDKWQHCTENEFNCYPTNYNPYDFIIHYMGSKSKINIKKRISDWNKYLKYENDKPLIYVSVATVPTRYKGLKLLIENLLSSTVKPDKIIFQIPKEYKLFETDNHIKLINELYKDYINKGIVYINVLDIDYGPANKYQGMVEYYEDNNLIDKNFVSIIIDDDLLYHNILFEELLKEHYKNNRSIITGYHMSKIHAHFENKFKSLIIKGADSSLIPKYFYIQNTNPSFKEMLDNAINKYEDCIFNDDNLITAFLAVKRINKISILDKLKEKGFSKSYSHNKTIKDYGVSNRKNKLFERSHIGKTMKDFFIFYKFDKYSNVKFN